MALEMRFGRQLSSEMFTFIVGPAKTQYVVHSAFLAAKSSPFDRMMHGSMSEAQQKCAELPEVTEAVFEAFLEFCYTGLYPIGAGAACIHCGGGQYYKRLVIVDCARNWTSKSRKGFKSTFQKLVKDVLRLADMSANSNQPIQEKLNSPIAQNLSQHLMSHTEVAVFADLYAVDGLRALAVAKLEHNLATCHVTEHTMPAIAQFLKHVHGNTVPCDMSTIDVVGDSLRVTALKFGAINVNDLVSLNSGKMFLKSEPDLANEIFMASGLWHTYLLPSNTHNRSFIDTWHEDCDEKECPCNSGP